MEIKLENFVDQWTEKGRNCCCCCMFFSFAINKMQKENCKNPLTISVVNFGWTSETKAVHHKSK